MLSDSSRIKSATASRTSMLTERRLSSVLYKELEQEASIRCLTPYKGYIYGIPSALLFCLANILIKKAPLLSASNHLTLSYFVNCILLLVLVIIRNEEILGPKHQRCLLLLRGLIQVAAYYTLYYGLILIPPSDCTAIGHTSIIFIAIMSRMFLDEKLGFAHVFALLLTILGVGLISKPTFLFHDDANNSPVMLAAFLNDTAVLVNGTAGDIEITNKILELVPDTYIQPIGVALIIASSFFFAVFQIITKKTCNINIDWSVSNLFAAYVGLPLCLTMSFLAYTYNLTHLELNGDLFYQILWSSGSAVFNLLGMIFLNIAFNYEEATKVAIAKTSDLLISFTLQYIMLSVQIDVFSVFGSLAIFLGTIIVLLHKMIETRYLIEAYTDNLAAEKEPSLFMKFVLFQI